jgi:hypothetical protein
MATVSKFPRQKVLEKIDLCQLFYFDRFCHYLCLPLDRFLLSSFDHRTFEEVATISYALMDGIFEFETEPKGFIYYHVYTNVVVGMTSRVGQGQPCLSADVP